jgi:ABC-2 type transport system ATP-binding protein
LLVTQQALSSPNTTHANDLFPASQATPAISVQDVVHRYPPASNRRRKDGRPTQGTSRELALDHVSLDIPQSGIFGLLGPNGGGKSTLFRIIATTQRATSGKVSVMGHDVLTHSHQVRSLLGVLFQTPSLDVHLTAYENLRYHGMLFGLKGAELSRRIDHWLESLGLLDNRDDRVMAFSGGMRRRLELAKALLHNPRILLLDEPATGLDPAARSDVWNHLHRLRQEHGVTIALTTHLMDEAERCDTLAIINDGRLVAVNTPTGFKDSIGGDIIVITPAGDPDAQAIEQIRQRAISSLDSQNLVTCSVVDGKIFVECPDGPAQVARIGAALAGDIRSISVGQPTLEDVFMHLTGRTMKRDLINI